LYFLRKSVDSISLADLVIFVYVTVCGLRFLEKNSMGPD
jgi:hypothetical protein